ncbi:ketosteroid isomerase-like protein [Paraburkholderia sp. BL18I3N2]|uniref:nuclear transport factor 2 family protein n=1 Tax=Paraburkholderia sp. BL18I3N2 TaxID=1938799 RepID=UPI000D049415|nr:nuclear transport factor 2 family protein [Paraburkholderia sp. BL18I3N2]PRX27341.1 ketosteroid isomerase-like protein [Paraburkholderia sp. BL18I3N2]
MTNESQEADQLREANKAAFTAMLGHLGRKEFDEFQGYLSETIFQDWPYLPIPNMPQSIVGSRQLREFIEAGTQAFDPYAYEISKFYDMADPSMLIVEYSSHTRYHPTDRPYSNSYLGILRFAEGKVTYWREYLNPLIIKESLLGDFEKPVEAS